MSQEFLFEITHANTHWSELCKSTFSLNSTVKKYLCEHLVTVPVIIYIYIYIYICDSLFYVGLVNFVMVTSRVKS